MKTVTEVSTSKPRHQYNILNKYEVLTCGGMEKLIREKTSPIDRPMYYATIEETYDIISKTHISSGHVGRERTPKYQKYATITNEAVELFKSYCLVCQEKKKRTKTTGVVVRHILSREFNSCGHAVSTIRSVRVDYCLPVPHHKVCQPYDSVFQENS